MSPSIPAFVLLSVVGLCQQAIAGPDRSSLGVSTQANASSEKVTASQERVALPLDHGPRAVTTPWNNQQARAAISARKALEAKER